jgi:hypothetical protein
MFRTVSRGLGKKVQRREVEVSQSGWLQSRTKEDQEMFRRQSLHGLMTDSMLRERERRLKGYSKFLT